MLACHTFRCLIFRHSPRFFAIFGSGSRSFNADPDPHHWFAHYLNHLLAGDSCGENCWLDTDKYNLGGSRADGLLHEKLLETHHPAPWF